MSLKGSLESFSLGEIFQSLSINQHTGTLVVEDGEVRKLIYFTNGHIIHLSTGKRDEFRLGDMLVWARHISGEQLDEAKVENESSGQRLGEILIQRGWVSDEEISNMVVKNIEEEIYDLFLWKKADFEFKVGYFPEEFLDADQKATRVQLSTNSLIMEALRRIDEWTVIRDRISTLKAVFIPSNGGLTSEGLEEIELPEIVKGEVRLVDGHRNVAEIVSNSPASKFEVCKLLYELLLRNLIRPLEVGELVALAEDQLSQGQFTEARKYLEFAVEQDPNNPDLRLQLAEAYSHTAADKAAVDHLLTAARLHTENEEHEMTVVAFRRALELKPTDPEIMENLFHSLMRAGKLVQAQTLGLELGELLRENLQFSKAVKVYERLVEKDPKETSVRMLLAGACKGKGDLERALTEYNRVADQLETEMRFTELEKVYRILKALATRDEDLIRIRRKYERIEQRKESRERRRKLIQYGSVITIGLAVLAVAWEFYSTHEYQKIAWPTVYTLSVKQGLSDEEIQKRIEKNPKDLDEYVKYVEEYEDWVGPEGECERTIKQLDEFRSKHFISLKGFKAKEDIETIRDLRRRFTGRRDEIHRKHEQHHQGKLEEEARKQLRKADTLLESTPPEYEKAYAIYLKIWNDMDLSETRKNLSLPLLVKSDPGGAQVYVDGTLRGTSTREGWLVRFVPSPESKTIDVRLERAGYEPATKKNLSINTFPKVTLPLSRKAIGILDLDGAVHGVPIQSEDQILFCTRGGGRDDSTKALLYRYEAGITMGDLPVRAVPPSPLAEPGGIIAGPVVHLGGLVAGTSEGKLWRIPFDDAPFKLIATVKSDETDVLIPITGGPAALPEQKELFYGTYDGRLFRFDPTLEGSKPEVIYRGENKITSVQCVEPPPGESRVAWVLLGSLDETVSLIRGDSGRVVWKFSANGDVVGPPLVTEKYVCVGTTLGSLFVLDRATGKVVTSRLQYGPIYSLAGSDTVLYVGAVRVKRSGLTALTLPECEKQWTWDTRDIVDSGITLHRGAVLFGDRSGRLTVLNGVTGEFLWDFQAQGPITAQPLGVGEKIYVGDSMGTVTVLDMVTDREGR